MPANVLYTGPKPPPGEQWCFVCAYMWKNAVNDAHAELIRAAESAPDGTVERIDGRLVQDAPMPDVAVTMGINAQVMQFGVLPLCWSHVSGVQFKTPSGIQLPGGIPGLPPGFGTNGMPPR